MEQMASIWSARIQVHCVVDVHTPKHWNDYDLMKEISNLNSVWPSDNCEHVCTWVMTYCAVWRKYFFCWLWALQRFHVMCIKHRRSFQSMLELLSNEKEKSTAPTFHFRILPISLEISLQYDILLWRHKFSIFKLLAHTLECVDVLEILMHITNTV